MDDKSKDALLGEPVSGWKTAVTHINSGIGIVFSVASIAMGAYGLIKGRNVFGGKMDAHTVLSKKDVKLLEKTLGKDTMKKVEETLVKTTGKIVRGTSVGLIASGAIGGLIQKAAWDSASSASRTRNYLQLQQRLNTQETTIAPA